MDNIPLDHDGLFGIAAPPFNFTSFYLAEPNAKLYNSLQMQPHKKDPALPRRDNHSLLSVLDAFDQLDEREQHTKKSHQERKGLDLNAP